MGRGCNGIGDAGAYVGGEERARQERIPVQIGQGSAQPLAGNGHNLPSHFHEFILQRTLVPDSRNIRGVNTLFDSGILHAVGPAR